MDKISLINESVKLSNNLLIVGYIDPGTGSLLFQFLIAALIGCIFYFRNLFFKIIKKVRKFFSFKSNDQ